MLPLTTKDKAYLEKLGGRIRSLRAEHNFSQPELARRVGYKRGYSIYAIEKGKITRLDISTLRKIASALDVTASDLLEE